MCFMDWRGRERTEKGAYLGEVLVLWCLFIIAGGGLDFRARW